LDVESDLSDLGVDSLGLAELLGSLEDSFGVGCITIDKIMDGRSVRAIAGHLGGKAERSIAISSRVTAVSPPVQPVISLQTDHEKAVGQSINMVARAAEAMIDFSERSDTHCWIRTTHVGSLPRPTDGNFDLGRVIQQQAEAGVDIVNDGEWTRDNYIADVINRIEGLRGGNDSCASKGCCTLHSMPVADDMNDVAVYAQRFTGGNGLITLNPKREVLSDLACVSHPRYMPAEIPSLKPFLSALTHAGKAISDSFYSVPSPGTLALFCTDTFFHDHNTYVEALGEALAGEFSQIAASGMQLQVDCPDLAMGRHTRWASLDDDAFIKVAQANVDALNCALRGVPFEQIRVHVCWGNYAGPHHKDISADLVWPLLGQVKAKYLLVEGANSRHRNDVASFERAVKNNYFKSTQVIVPGMLDTTTARIEEPRSIAESLLRYVRAAGHPSRVLAGTDCGFASTAKSTAITSDIAWMKLKSLAEGARLATKLLIEQGAAVPCRSPSFKSTPFRAAIIAARSDAAYANELASAFADIRTHSIEILFEKHFEALRWAVDVPLALVGIGMQGALAAERVQKELIQDTTVSRRPATLVSVGADGAGLSLTRGAASDVAAAVRDAALGKTRFDKRCLVLPRSGAVPTQVDVVVIGAGLLGMVTARRCVDAGFSVAVLEQRSLVGGIWSMYANATSQVNSSEGGYCIKEFIGEEGGKHGDNRDHSTAAEILKDFAKLGDSLKEHIFSSVKVVKVLGEEGDYNVVFEDAAGSKACGGVTKCMGVVLCINDRVGMPRPLASPGREQFKGVVADGTADSLSGVDWRGKRVVISGMGAFAVENVRTALENGAAEVTVVGRRHGTICPKVIDYLNFVKPWDSNYKHETQTNVKQFLRWKELYAAAGCTVPECWPKQVKHEGHTISVSDVWFIGHFMKKLSTRAGEIERIQPDGVVSSDGEFIPCDVVIGCIGFHRSSYLCEYLTGRSEVKTTNYLDKNMMYLADAEIDEGAFNSFLGSSVLEYGKFFSNVYVEGLKRGEELGECLWGSDTVSVPITQRKWNQYIAAGFKLINSDAAIAQHARTQVDKRTEHFWRTLPPQSFIAVNKKEWEELHQRLNGGVPVPKEQQLPYFFDEASEWCGQAPKSMVATMQAPPPARASAGVIVHAQLDDLAKPAATMENSWIRTTHVGSLPRPTDGNFDLGRVIQQQEEAGVDIVNDGEWTRDNYIADVINRIEGLRGGDGSCASKGCCTRHSMPIADDMKDVPVYAQRFTGGNGLITLNPKREALSDLACVSHPRYMPGDIPALKLFLDALSMAGKPASEGFYSVPSPGTLALFCADTFFHDHKAYVQALGKALAGEFAQIAASGMQLQVDCPDLAMGRHTRWAGLDDDAFIKVAQENVDALNRALRHVPFEQIRVHVCWGNYAGPHHKDISADLVWPLLGQLKAKYLLVEGANSRHSNDVAAFERAVVKGYFKSNQVIVPGMLDTTTARIEEPMLIAESLLRYVRAAGHPSRVLAGTDCGFASTAKSTAITSDIAWMKLKSLAEGARLATKMLIEQGAAVPCRSPSFKSTPFRAAIIAARSDAAYANELASAFAEIRAHSVEILFENHFEALRWAVDVPLALVGIGTQGALDAKQVQQELVSDTAVTRRPATLVSVGAHGEGFSAASEVAAAVRDAALKQTDFDKRCLVLPRSGCVPSKVDVVVVGAGLLGMVTARRCVDAGFSVAVLEQRPLVGGIWSMYANSTSQVNSSEGGYCIKEFVGEEDGKYGDNRDHSTAAEILKDFAKLGDSLKEHIFSSVRVVKVLGKEGDYNVVFEDAGGSQTRVGVAQCMGVVLCINDRVGMPRPLASPGREQFKGVVADGTADSLSGVDWRGKRVVIAGMGAFAVENVRTALENGAAEVTVVGRRHGTICPKVIDYLNFVKPWDSNYKHETETNVKQFLRWKELYAAAGCTVPECWPKQVKHEGHTISVSDVWFVGHFMKKLSTRAGEIDRIERDGVVISSSGEFIPCDVVIGCIGFHRSSYLCEYLTGRSEVKTTNYLDKNMMYLADAEIDEGAFNSFFGSSVLEYGKFFSNVYVEGLKRGEELCDRLWGSDTKSVPITERKWNQYIAAGFKLINSDEAIAKHARTQVDKRTAHFWRTLPPQSFVSVNKKEWEELHKRLNGGVPVPKEQQLPYFFDEAPDWCGEAPKPSVTTMEAPSTAAVSSKKIPAPSATTLEASLSSGASDKYFSESWIQAIGA